MDFEQFFHKELYILCRKYGLKTLKWWDRTYALVGPDYIILFSGDSSGVRSYGEVVDLLVSWHYQRVVQPSIIQTEKKFDPYDENQVDLTGIVHAKKREPAEVRPDEGGGVG